VAGVFFSERTGRDSAAVVPIGVWTPNRPRSSIPGHVAQRVSGLEAETGGLTREHSIDADALFSSTRPRATLIRRVNSRTWPSCRPDAPGTAPAAIVLQTPDDADRRLGGTWRALRPSCWAAGERRNWTGKHENAGVTDTRRVSKSVIFGRMYSRAKMRKNT
jgi:hypothetical protein